jgi:ubiquinone/menaquinone biosynthesis C-methylase UbiE
MSKEARQYDNALYWAEKWGLRRLRQTLVDEVRGAVLEIGVGTGLNLPLYGENAQVYGLDLNRARLVGSCEKLQARPALFSQANAQELPFAADQFDFVVGTLVFCSIPQPEQALAEIKRVLKPHGRLYLLEHTRGQTPLTRRLTDWLHPFWFALQGECHLNRETGNLVQQAGFALEHNSVHGRGVLQMLKARVSANSDHS